MNFYRTLNFFLEEKFSGFASKNIENLNFLVFHEAFLWPLCLSEKNFCLYSWLGFILNWDFRNISKAVKGSIYENGGKFKFLLLFSAKLSKSALLKKSLDSNDFHIYS